MPEMRRGLEEDHEQTRNESREEKVVRIDQAPGKCYEGRTLGELENYSSFPQREGQEEVTGRELSEVSGDVSLRTD